MDEFTESVIPAFQPVLFEVLRENGIANELRYFYTVRVIFIAPWSLNEGAIDFVKRRRLLENVTILIEQVDMNRRIWRCISEDKISKTVNLLSISSLRTDPSDSSSTDKVLFVSSPSIHDPTPSLSDCENIILGST